MERGHVHTARNSHERVSKLVLAGTFTGHRYVAYLENSSEFPDVHAASPNFVSVIECLSIHVAYIIAEAHRKYGDKPIIEPTAQAQEEWTMRLLAGAATFSSMAGCTPGTRIQWARNLSYFFEMHLRPLYLTALIL